MSNALGLFAIVVALLTTVDGDTVMGVVAMLLGSVAVITAGFEQGVWSKGNDN